MNTVYITFAFLLSTCVLAQRPPLVNPISTPIRDGNLRVTTRLFAKIPNFNGGPARINHLTFQGDDLYVSTETSGGLVYKITPTGSVSLFANVADLVRVGTGRQMDFTNRAHGGLRSIAFHPGFNRNGLFYASFMERRPPRNGPNNLRYLSDASPRPIPADSVVAEFRFNRRTNRVARRSYRQVLRVGMPVYDHPIKDIAFRGNLLYITHGDGSVQSATTGGGQRNDGLGKVLRINPRKRGNLPYTVPRSNPFVNNPMYLDEIWALGFRNPHNLCFSNRGELFVTEVGRDNVEEINIVRPGGNYGWSEREGTFVLLPEPGVLTGVAPLPADDARFGFIYPNVQVGHRAPEGRFFVGQALVGSCPVENGSPNNGVFFYSNFPTNGELYYSRLNDMRRARVTGPPNQLTQAPVFQAKILFDHDNLPLTPPREYNRLGDLLRAENGLGRDGRVDIRMGRGRRGELYWTSKRTGEVYLFTSTLPA